MESREKAKILKEIINKLCESDYQPTFSEPLASKIIEKKISQGYRETPQRLFNKLKSGISEQEELIRENKGNYFSIFFHQNRFLVAASFACIVVASIVVFYNIKPLERTIQFQNNIINHSFNNKEQIVATGLLIKFQKKSLISLKKDKEYSVVMHYGQVIFSIDHSIMKKKFFIFSAGYLIESIGTKFIITLDAETNSIKLIQGSIRVFPFARKLIQHYNAPKEIILPGINAATPGKRGELDNYIKNIKYKYAILLEKPLKNSPENLIKEKKSLPGKENNNFSGKRSKADLKYQRYIGKKSIVYLKNGDRITGKIIRVETKWIYIQSSRGELKVPENDIKKIHFPER